jgi:IclR family acetate operon transcriptional repressor
VDSEPTLIESVRRALNLLDVVGAADRPLSAKILARRAGLAQPTAYHLLRTLVHEGYLGKVDGQGYVLGERVAALARRLGSRAARTVRFRPILRELHDTLNAAAYVAVLDDGEITVIDIVDSPAAPRADLWVGFHEAAHATALGKAVLSALDGQARRAYLADHELPELTPRTVTDRRVLLRELAGVGDYALDREEYALGTACIAIAVPSSSLVAAVAVSVPSHQAQRIVEHSDIVRRAALLVAYADAV